MIGKSHNHGWSQGAIISSMETSVSATWKIDLTNSNTSPKKKKKKHHALSFSENEKEIHMTIHFDLNFLNYCNSNLLP